MHGADATPQNADVSKVLFDCTDASAIRAWSAVDDRVMGGVSRSTLERDPAGHAVVKGTVSLQRNGGFASVRSSPGDRGHVGAEACLIEVRGDNKQFKLSLLTDDGFDSLNYQATFAPAGVDWQTLHLPLADFRASFRGREVPDAPPTYPDRRRFDQSAPSALSLRPSTKPSLKGSRLAAVAGRRSRKLRIAIPVRSRPIATPLSETINSLAPASISLQGRQARTKRSRPVGTRAVA